MKNIVFVGPPGSGKGTQAKKLGKQLKLPVFSTGDILRQEVADKSRIGEKVKDLMEEGKFVPDRIVNKIVFEMLEENGPGFILDGYPRNEKQAKAIVKFFKKKEWELVVFEFILDDKIAVERISGRRTCSCGHVYHLKYNPPKVDEICDECGKKLIERNDQKPAVVGQRLKIYHEITKPLIEYIKEQKKIGATHYLIDANKQIDEIQKDIMLKI